MVSLTVVAVVAALVAVFVVAAVGWHAVVVVDIVALLLMSVPSVTLL